MINLSLDELKQVTETRNIGDYENKSDKDLIKALSRPKPKRRINEKKLEESRKGFNQLRHEFLKKKLKSIEKLFIILKTTDLSRSQIKEARKNLHKLKKV